MLWLLNINFNGTAIPLLVNPKNNKKFDLLLTFWDDLNNKTVEILVHNLEETKDIDFPQPYNKVLVPVRYKVGIKFAKYLKYTGVVHDSSLYDTGKELSYFCEISKNNIFLASELPELRWNYVTDLIIHKSYIRKGNSLYFYEGNFFWFCYEITDEAKFDLLATKCNCLIKR